MRSVAEFTGELLLLPKHLGARKDFPIASGYHACVIFPRKNAFRIEALAAFKPNEVLPGQECLVHCSKLQTLDYNRPDFIESGDTFIFVEGPQIIAAGKVSKVVEERNVS